MKAVCFILLAILLLLCIHEHNVALPNPHSLKLVDDPVDHWIGLGVAALLIDAAFRKERGVK